MAYIDIAAIQENTLLVGKSWNYLPTFYTLFEALPSLVAAETCYLLTLKNYKRLYLRVITSR